MSRDGNALFSVAFRPFFLMGSCWIALALAVWIISFVGGRPLNTALPAVSWHIHAMLFGFVLAAIAGFILTAVASWTGRPPINGSLLALLALLWALGRVLNLFSALAPFWIVAATDVAFPLALALLVAREIVAARSRRNFMMPIPIALLAVADALMYLEAAGVGIPTGLGWRLALAAVITLISVVGARIVPTLTRNWLARRGAAALPRSHRWLDGVGSATLHTGLLAWALFPAALPAGLLLLLGAALTFARFLGWKGWTTLDEPLLWILHAGYLWMIVGAALLGLAVIAPVIPESAAVHALTAGAIGTMVLAVMTRVCRGHTGRPLAADRLAVVIYLSVNAAGVVRVAAELLPDAYQSLLEVAAILWIGAFLLFALWSAPVVWRPRTDRQPAS
jgi:uncharacterized protein involved in response to NO